MTRAMSVPEIIRALDRSSRARWEREAGRPLEQWWPISGKFDPPHLEIVIGALLTQNTNWRNVELALRNLEQSGMKTAADIGSCSVKKLERLVQPAGFFRQKAARLQALCLYIIEFEGDFYRDVTRQQLLGLVGIGPETADAILLYACGRPEFVIDAYTVRIFSRLGVVPPGIGYADAKAFFEGRMRPNTRRYREAHALIVEHAKTTCRKTPRCGQCPVQRTCGFAIRGHRSL